MKNDDWKHRDFTGIKIAVNEEIKLTIDPREYFSATFVYVEQYERYKFTVEPNDLWKDFFKNVNANGFNNWLIRNSKLRVPNENCFKLCGTINADHRDNFELG